MRLTVLVGFVLTVALALGVGSVDASNEISEREGDMVCTSCHDKPGSRLLTDQGKYYDLMRSLDGYTEIQATFGRCTACHKRQPGSHKLTKAGKRYEWMMEDMNGVKAFVMEHPTLEPLEAPPDQNGDKQPADSGRDASRP